MTLFGVLWILISIYCFSRRDIRYMVSILIFSMTLQCNTVIQIGALSSGPQLYTSLLFILKFLIWKKGKVSKFSNWLEKSIFLLLIYIVIQTCFLSTNITYVLIFKIIQLFIYGFTCFFLGQVARQLNEEYVYRLIKSLTIFLLIVGGLELLIGFFNISRENPLKYLIYNEQSGVAYYKNIVRFYSTFMEPSYCSGTIVGLLFFYVETYSDQTSFKYKQLIIGLLSLAIVLTLSPTAYGALAVVLIIYVLRNYKKRKLWFLAPVGIILIVIGFQSGLFSDIIITKLNSKSGVARSNLNSHAFELFKTSPIFGNGYKTSRASSVLFTMLAELGLTGACIYSSTVLFTIYKAIKGNKLIGGAAFILLCNFVASTLSCPDLDLCGLWLAYYIFSVAINVLYKTSVSEEKKGIGIAIN